MQRKQEDESQGKLDQLYEMFPHVECAEVRDIFDGVGKNILTATQQLTMIYGEKPLDMAEQFKIIDDAAYDGDDVYAEIDHLDDPNIPGFKIKRQPINEDGDEFQVVEPKKSKIQRLQEEREQWQQDQANQPANKKNQS